MGIWDIVKGELIEVISSIEDTGDTMVWRFPDQDHQIKMGAQLTVREGQAAVFVNEGRIADVFPPGLYELSTRNMPVMTTLQSWKYGFESPFKAEIYFISTKNFVDLKWGTQNPIIIQDEKFGVVRVRAFGTYGMKVVDPATFMKQLVGTQEFFIKDDIEGQLRSIVVSSFSEKIALAKISVLDLAAHFREVAQSALEIMSGDFRNYGLSLTQFVIENVSVPPEVEKIVDAKAQMELVGDLDRFTKFQAAMAITDAAKSGGAGEFLGMGAGMALGKQMADSMASVVKPNDTKTDANSTKFCSQCGKNIDPGAKFCPECGTARKSSCGNCGKETQLTDKFCSECGKPTS